MIKVYYGLVSDIVEKGNGNISLLDVLQKNKYTIYTELSQLRSEKIEIAYINYNETVLTQICDLNIKKISVFTKGDDNIIVPRNFVKYSSNAMIYPSGFYNIILNNIKYKPDNEIIITGKGDKLQDLLRNIYSMFGNVIMSVIGNYDVDAVKSYILSRSIPNTGDIYFNAFTALEGLKRCVTKKNIVIMRCYEIFTDITAIIQALQSNEKIVITNAGTRKVSKLKYNIGDHIIAGKYSQIFSMYSNAINILNNKVCEMRKKLRIEYTPEQILTVSCLFDKIDYMASRDEKYVRELLQKNFIMVDIDALGTYKIPWGQSYFTNGNKEIYAQLCEIKNINDI